MAFSGTLVHPLDAAYDSNRETSSASAGKQKAVSSSSRSIVVKVAAAFLCIIVMAGIVTVIYFVVSRPCTTCQDGYRRTECTDDIFRVYASADVVPTWSQDFGFASYYQSNMVLQREPHNSIIWGYGVVGATVNITVNAEIYSTKVVQGQNGQGVWSVKIAPQPATARTDIAGIHDDGGTLQYEKITNVLFGDVFVCSGQSNMQMTLTMVSNWCEELAATSNYPDVRVFTVTPLSSSTPLYDFAFIRQSWTVPSPDTMAGPDDTYFSALCWFYGRSLYDELQIPIGLLASSRGATVIEGWLSPTVLQKCPESSSTGDGTADSYKAGYYHLYNAMIHPLFNLTIKGVIWYQGESNAIYQTDSYQCRFSNMIKDWRERWYEGSQNSTDRDFPFGFIQIGGQTSIFPNYPAVRWHQTADYGFVPNPEMENTFMAVAMDLPDPDSPYRSIHPRHKQDLAVRLVAGALSSIYNRTVVHEGPFPENVTELDSNQIVIQYPLSQQLVVTDQSNFQICCHGSNCSVNDPEVDEKWRTTSILEYSDHTITLDTQFCQDESKLVDKIRYAWALNPCAFKKCSVYNTFGFPGAPYILQVNDGIS